MVSVFPAPDSPLTTMLWSCPRVRAFMANPETAKTWGCGDMSGCRANSNLLHYVVFRVLSLCENNSRYLCSNDGRGIERYGFTATHTWLASV